MASKYISIAREIKQRILSQQYSSNEPLPDQFALAAEFNTSRMTIQQAMRQLIVEGLVYTRKGLGTFVRKNFMQLSRWDLPGSDYYGATKTGKTLARSPVKSSNSSCVSRRKKSRTRYCWGQTSRSTTLIAYACWKGSRCRWNLP
jgi:DNA-binding transcriptional MocR family regulator